MQTEPQHSTFIGMTIDWDGARREVLHLLPGSLVDGKLQLYDVIVSDELEVRKHYRDVSLGQLEGALRPSPAEKHAMATFMSELGDKQGRYDRGEVPVDALFAELVAAFRELAYVFAGGEE